jgi:hypothetical protein
VNSVQLLDALEKKTQDTSLIFEALVKRGTISSVEHMQKLWKRKSLFLAGKAEFLMKNYDAAVGFLDIARKIIAGDANCVKEEEEIKNLLALASNARKQVQFFAHCRNSIRHGNYLNTSHTST